MNKTKQIEQMLPHIKAVCDNCTMCQLGREQHIHNNQLIEPHVFSNMKPSEYVVIGQNPGYNECVADEPFVGDAGKNFNKEISKHGLDRDKFYITNIVHCHTPENRAPSDDEIKACRPILELELRLLRPKLIITLGSFAFSALIPDKKYSESLGNINNIDIAGLLIPVFSILHPSGRNLSMQSRRLEFEHQIALIAKLIKQFLKEENKH